MSYGARGEVWLGRVATIQMQKHGCGACLNLQIQMLYNAVYTHGRFLRSPCTHSRDYYIMRSFGGYVCAADPVFAKHPLLHPE